MAVERKKRDSSRNASRKHSAVKEMSASFQATITADRSGGTSSPTYLALMGLADLDGNQLRKQVESGLAFGVFDRVRTVMGLSIQEAAGFVQIPITTLSRRKAEGRLHPEESDRLVRASKILAMALELFSGNMDAARHWLETPKAALGGESPRDAARTEVGARMVEDLIGRIEHGVYT